MKNEKQETVIIRRQDKHIDRRLDSKERKSQILRNKRETTLRKERQMSEEEEEEERLETEHKYI